MLIKNATPLYIQTMFVQRLGYIRNFKKKNDNVWNFSCPLCGDSTSNKFKARGYLYDKGGNIIYSCHNCGTNMSFSKFLKEINPSLYAEFKLETLRANGTDKKEEFDYNVHKHSRTVNIKEKNWQSCFYKITELPILHSAVKYIKSRKIPNDRLNDIYYTDAYQTSIKHLNGFFEQSIDTENIPDDARIIFPFIDSNFDLKFLQGRSIDEDPKIRYITTKITDELKLFGIDGVNISNDIFVLEGPIDSMMLDNAVATADAALERASYLLPKEKLVLVFDNEPRSLICIKKMETAIKHGFRVVIMPQSIKEKDLNLMTINGHNTKSIVESSIYSGARAILELNRWKKI